MIKNVQKIATKVSGIELSPGDPAACLGNRGQDFESFCDKCDCYLLCFHEFDLINEEKTDDTELPSPSKRHKIRMNRLFRERVGGSFLPFPEVDCFYERARSKLVVKLKINEFLDNYKERRRAR